MALQRAVLEEISLEGLDGITLPTLWYRLSKLPDFPVQLDDKAKQYIWNNVILKLSQVQIYELPVSRPTISDHNPKYTNFDLEIYAPHPTLTIYPGMCVEGRDEHGSCSTYDSRKLITDEVAGLTLEEATEKWPQTLVIVASQRCREEVLFRDASDPHAVGSNLPKEMYLLVEQMARSRHEGVLGSDAFAHLSSVDGLKATHGRMGYLRKKLRGHGLMATQNIIMVKQFGKHSRVTHEKKLFLRRYFSKSYNSPYFKLHTRIENYLLAQPDRHAMVVTLYTDLEEDRRRVTKFFQMRRNFFEMITHKVTRPCMAPGGLPPRKKKKVDKNPKLSQGRAGTPEKDGESPTMPEATPQATPAKMKEDNSPPPGQSSSHRELSQISHGISGFLDDSTGDPFVLDTSAKSTPSHTPAKHAKLAVRVESPANVMGETGDWVDESIDQSVNNTLEVEDEPQNSSIVNHLGTRNCLGVKLKMTLAEYDAQEEDKDEEDEKGEPIPPVVRSPNKLMLQEILQWMKIVGSATRTMLRDAFGLHTLQARQMMKMMRQLNLMDFYYEDMGRQKVEKFRLKLEVPGNESAKSEAASKAPPITHRAMERSALIVDTCEKCGLIIFSDLHKLIKEAETPKYETQLDRKTLKRLCEKLHREGSIRIYKTKIQVGKRSRDLFYVCRADITLDDTQVQASLEQQKSILAVSGNSTVSKMKPSTSERGDASSGPLMENYRYDRDVSVNKYGYAAKLKRTELLHKFLCYVNYSYEGVVPPGISCKARMDPVNGDISRLPVYVEQTSWKRFIPPHLLNDAQKERGLSYLIDLGTQLPLTLFLSLVKLPYYIQELIDYMDDPIKRTIPVRHLPVSMQAPLLHKGKYIACLRDTVQMLFMMGLATNLSVVETGQTFKDINYIYLHKIGVCRDTSASPEEEPQLMKFRFDNGMFGVEDYWTCLRTICTSTAIAKCKPGDERPDIFKKDILQHCLQPTTFDQVMEGQLPGDGLGAGGLDSMFYSHLNRQWTSAFQKMVPNPEGLSLKKRLHMAASREEKRKQLLIPNDVPVASSIVPIIHTHEDTTPRKRRARALKPGKSAKSKKKEQRREKDEKDLTALAMLETQRSRFSQEEDKMMLLAKVGFIMMNARGTPKELLRDCLHKHGGRASANKSSVSCVARLTRLIQHGKCDAQLNFYLDMARQAPEMAKYEHVDCEFGTPEYARKYEELTDMLVERLSKEDYMDDLEVQIDLDKIPSVAALKKNFRVKVMEENVTVTSLIPGTGRTPVEVVNWKEPISDSEIARFTLKNFIISYLLLSDKISRSYQMHKVFEQYPSALVDQVLKELTRNKVINTKKLRRFNLSFRYKLFMDKVQPIRFDNYLETGSIYEQLHTRGSMECGGEEWRGILVTLLALAPIGSVELDVQIPDRVIDTSDVPEETIDPEQEEDEDQDEKSYKKRSQRFEKCQIKPCVITARLNDDKLPKALSATRRGDREILRTRCISSVPYNVEVERTFEEEFSLSERTVLRQLYDRIDAAGAAGLSERELIGYESPKKALTLLTQLLEVCLIVAVGSSERRYTSHVNSRMWIVHSLKDTKGRMAGVSLSDTDKIPLTDSDVTIAVATAEEEPAKSTEPMETKEETEQPRPPQTTYRRVDIIPRPWLTPEDTLNYNVLQPILCAVLSSLNVTQGITLERLHNEFSMCYSRLAVIELLQILEDIGAVQRLYLTPVHRIKETLFSPRVTFTTSSSPTCSNSVCHYKSTQHSLLRLSQFIHHTRLKRPAK